MPCFALAPMVWMAKALVRLPPALLLGLSRALALSAAPLLARRRRIIAANLALCFPGLGASARARLQRDTLAETIMGVFELLRAWYAPAWRLRDAAEVTGLGHLRAALADGRGVLLFTGHFTQSELASRQL